MDAKPIGLATAPSVAMKEEKTQQHHLRANYGFGDWKLVEGGKEIGAADGGSATGKGVGGA